MFVPILRLTNTIQSNSIQFNPIQSNPTHVLQYGAWKAHGTLDMVTYQPLKLGKLSLFPFLPNVEGLAARCNGQN